MNTLIKTLRAWKLNVFSIAFIASLTYAFLSYSCGGADPGAGTTASTVNLYIPSRANVTSCDWQTCGWNLEVTTFTYDASGNPVRYKNKRVTGYRGPSVSVEVPSGDYSVEVRWVSSCCVAAYCPGTGCGKERHYYLSPRTKKGTTPSINFGTPDGFDCC